MAKQELGPLQRKWVKALRSGEYKQGTRFLHSGRNCFCCLGVAQYVVLGINTPMREEGVLCGKAVELMKFYSSVGSIQKGWPFGPDLSSANDIHGRSFAEIADFVEAHPEAVFTEPA